MSQQGRRLGRIVGAPLVVALALAGAAPAQQPSAAVGPAPPEVSPDRPDFTNGTDVVPLGYVQLECGMTATFTGDDREVSIGEALLRVPVSRRVEVGVGIPSFLATREGGDGSSQGADDMYLATKVRLVSGERVAFAVLVNAVLPTGSHEVAERRFQPSATLAADVSFSERVGLSANLGAERASAGGERFDEVFASASLGVDLAPKVGSFAEVYALNRTEPGGRAQRYADAGLSFRVTPRTVLDARVGVGLWNGMGRPDCFFGFGLTRLFGKGR